MRKFAETIIRIAHRISGTSRRFGHLEIMAGGRTAGSNRKIGVLCVRNPLAAWISLAGREMSIIQVRYPIFVRNVSRLDVLLHGTKKLNWIAGGTRRNA